MRKARVEQPSNAELNENGYWVSNGYLVHRVIYRRYYGKIPRGWHIHHVDGDKQNNHYENLIGLPAAVHEALHKRYRIKDLPNRKLIEALWINGDLGPKPQAPFPKAVVQVQIQKPKPRGLPIVQKIASLEGTINFHKNQIIRQEAVILELRQLLESGVEYMPFKFKDAAKREKRRARKRSRLKAKRLGRGQKEIVVIRRPAQ